MRLLPAPLVLLLALGGCGDGEPTLFERAVDLAPLSGTEQSGTVGAAAQDTPRVRALDTRGNPAAGARVRFEVRSGGGSVSHSSVLADERGIASPGTWSLGPGAGDHRLEAIIPGADPLEFRASAGPGEPDTLTIFAGQGAIGTVGFPVNILPGVTIRDRFGNPVPGIPVRFVLVEGDGSVEGGDVVSDKDGRARPANWVLGPTAGLQAIEARVESLPPARFQLMASPSAADSLRLLDFSVQGGTVGDTVGPILLEVRDRFGNPVQETTLQWWSPAGGGALHPEEPRTGTDGRVEAWWILGARRGPQRLEMIAPPATQTITLEVEAAAGPPAILVVVEGEGQMAPGGSPVPEPPAVRLTDGQRNPLAGELVDFEVISGMGRISGSPALTGEDGIARLAGWIMGVENLPQSLLARHGSLQPVEIRATAAAASRSLDIVEGGETHSAPAGTPISPSPAVRLRDSEGTPVEGATVTFEVVEGGGTVSPAEVTTGGDGTARLGEWRLGSSPGWNRVRASASGAVPVGFSAQGLAGLQVMVNEVHLNQGSQTYPASMPLVEGRPGLLRVFLQANDLNGETPNVRVEIDHGGAVVFSELIPSPSTGIPLTVDPDLSNRSWDIELPSELVVPGLGIRVRVDEEEDMPVLDRTLLDWPRTGQPHRPEVRTTPPFRSTFIRLHSTSLSTTADLSDANLGDYLRMTLDLYPIAEYNALVRPETYTTTASPLTGSGQSRGWEDLVREIYILRLADRAEDPDASLRYYHGILRRGGGTGIVGMAYVAEHPEDSILAAVSHDEPTSRSWVVAHEFGHTFGRRHTPCGVPGGDIDLDFPRAEATLGSTGYSRESGAVIPSDGFYRDVMSYCTPAWASDYTYAAVLAMREARPVGAPQGTISSSQPVEGGLLFWGEWSDVRGPLLLPAIPMAGRASSPGPGPGAARLVGYDAGGTVLFDTPVRGLSLDHGEDASLRHFAHHVPLTEADRALLHRVELATPVDSTSMEVPEQGDGPAGSPAASNLQVESVLPPSTPGTSGTGVPADSWIRVRWNAEAYPLAVIRDGTSGRILSLARAGEVVMPAPGSGRLALDLSRGIRTLREIADVPR
ncbi:MAG: hypothetical protein WD960_03160 [Gemmatimonadota bacterium]